MTCIQIVWPSVYLWSEPTYTTPTMPTALQPSPTSPRHRATKPAAQQPKPAAAKKLPKAVVETTAIAFMAAFQALPGVVQWRIVQMIEAYEDELDEKQLAAERSVNPEDFDPKNAVPWEQVKAELAARNKNQADTQQQAA